MKQYLYKFVSCLLLIVAAVSSGHAALTYGDPKTYNLCQGDTLKLDKRQIVVYSDTVLYDTTTVVTTPPAMDSVVVQYVVNIAPSYLFIQERTMDQGHPFPWRDQTITKAGTYERVFKTKQECDSIYRLVVRERVETYITDTLCAGQSITFGGQTLTKTGVYKDSVHFANYDSITILSLIGKSDTTIERRSIPEGSNIVWNNRTLSQTGMYDEVLTNRFGCDSLNRLYLTVYHIGTVTYESPIDYKICRGDTIEVDKRKTVIYQDTILYDTIVTSTYPPVKDTLIRTYNVSMYPSFVKIEPDRTVERGGDPFDWHGVSISKAGSYEKVFKTVNGCDSIFRINVRERVETNVVQFFCTGSSISFGGQTITEGGVYRDTIHMALYDSIVIMALNAVKPDTVVTNSRIPEGTSVTWNNEEISVQGTYDVVKPNRFGCDSLSRLNLVVYHVDTIDTTVNICPNLSYTWHGMTYGQTGIYSTPGTRDNGDRVIYRMDLTVRPLQEVTKSFRICDGESVSFNGKTYTEAGTFFDHATCDTIYKILIQKNPTTLHLQTGVLDATHPYYWQYSLNGVIKVDTIYDAGTYEHTTLNEETGCNDTWRLELTKDETKYHFIEEVTVCESEPFNWHGLSNLNKQGIGQTIHYFDKHRTAADQDSIYELILTVKPVLRSTQTIPFCNSIEWNGVTYTQSAVIVDTLKSSQYNCDSIITTILSKGIAFHHHDTISIYPGETTMWRGQTITHDGQYEERHLNAFGCDSVYTLGVGLRDAAPVTNTRSYNVAICEGDYYQWEVTGEKYFNTGDYTEPGTVDPDSVYILHLTVNPKYATSERVTFTHFPASYRDQIIYETTDYVDVHYTSSLGCDSIIRVYVDREVIRDEISATICPGETYTWRNHEYREAYRYIETEKGVDGKDSVEHILNLSVRYIPETRINQNICEGGSYTFGNQVLTQTGVYRHTFHEDGCDSVVVLSLNVVKADTNTFVHHMEQGDSYVWNGNTYWLEGTYYDHRTNRFGCDSINVLELTVNHVDTVDTTVVICPNEIPFRWHGIRASQSGEFMASERQDDGSYNFYRLHLTVRELVRIDTTFTICDDQQITFNGKTYSESGRFFDYLSCDTLMEVIINKHPQQVYATTASLSDDHGYTWTYWDNGVQKTETFTTPGNYEFESPNATTGCSEIWRLNLTKSETEYHFVENLTICENDEFSWHGQSGLNHQGIGSTSIYYDKYVTRSGKDSIYQLNLTVNPLKRSTQTISFCESYTFNGKTYTSSTTVIDTLKTTYGCDSIVTTMLVKGNSFHRHDTATIVPGETLYWRGQTITNSGLYKDKHTSVSGCDSIYTLGVGMEEAAPQMKIRTWNESICEGDTYPWRGKNYFNTGTYVDTVYVGSTYVVDSLYILNLTVNPVYRWSERITFTTFPANYRNHTFAGPTTIEIRYASTEGCDSILTLSVDQEVIRDEVTEVICPGETFMWRGNSYSATNRYTEIEKGSKGQDSIEHILNLVVRYIPDTYITKTICNGSSYTFGDRVLTESGNYTYTFHTTCDSTVHLSLNVLSVDTNKLVHHMNDGETYTWNGKIYDKTGTYFYYGTNRFGCDSVAVLELTVNKVDTIDSIATICPSTTLYWHGISASQSGDYYSSEQQSDGSYNYYRLHLTVLELQQIDTTFTICGDESVSFNGQTYTKAGHYDNYLTCDTLIRVHINQHPQRIYTTQAALGGDHGYSWTYWDNGVQKTDVFTEPGSYEFESPNTETGCSEIWRLILSKDEYMYHFEEWVTVCQGDPFVWHGHAGWSNQHVGETTDYEHKYQTRNGKDSIYTLHLTVNPVARTYRTITFCGETTYKGKTYTESAQVVDTLTGANGCDSIVTINLDKVNSYIFDETHDLPQGEIYMWRGQPIGTDGVYYDSYQTIYGCDSIYRLTVNIIPASPQVNQYTDTWSLCKGDTVEWRGKHIWLEGNHIDTVWADGHTKVDSIFILNITINPSYKDTIYRHMYTCSDGAAIYYQGKAYYENDTVISNLHTIHGCDSIVKVYMHFNTATFLERSDTIVDTELPYTWTYQLPDPQRADTVLTTSGTYHHFTTSEGGCTNEERLTLVVRPTYLYEKDTTVCEYALPFQWHGQSLQHEIGETKQYEDHLTSIYGTDSIYRLNLTIVAAPTRTERISICENKDTIINGKSYFDRTLYQPGVVYHDTAYKFNDGNVCDSIIYYEITITPQRHIVETRIKHVGETFDWHGETISDHETKVYTIEDEIDPNTGCEIIYQLRVIAESAEYDQICELNLPYTWDKNNQNYLTSGIYTDTVRDAQGYITDFYSLTLQVDTVAKATQYYYVCVGHPATIYGRTYGDNPLLTDYVDEFTVPYSVPGNLCTGELTVVVTVSTEKIQENTVVLLQGESLDWNKYHITEGGEYRDTTTIDASCDSISILYVIAENRTDVTVCTNDTAADVHENHKYPYVWTTPRGKKDTLYVSGIYTDTVFNAKGFIEEYNTLHLTVTQPYDTTVIVHGCEDIGAYWRDEIFFQDTTFVDRVPVNPYTPDAPCDSVFHVTIKIDKVYNILRYDTICEHELPYVVGQPGNRLDSVYRDGWLPPFEFKTACGCDSIIKVHLTIIPDFDIDGSDSVFVCEEAMPMYIGDTEYPAFDPYRQKVNEWKGKWIGVKITNDTVIYNCGKVDSLHIIMRPHQAHIPVYEYSLCQGDSVQLFWPHKDTWIKEPGDYTDTVITISAWEDTKHHTIIHNDRAYECDSIVTWKVRYADTLHVHMYEHIRQGDTYRFNDSILTTTGVYDSIGYYINITDPLDPSAPAVTMMDSSHHYCKAVYTLHLTVDPVYRYGDTIEICHLANREYTYTFNDDLTEHYQFKFQTPDQDTALIHLTDSTKHLSYEFYDHFYDLVVYYKQKYEVTIKDSICYGDSIQFDRHYFENENNVTVERYLKEAGNYSDTLVALNGCDSIINLYLYVRDRVITEPQSATVTDRQLPYEWTHTWREPGATTDTTHIDSLYVTGDYEYTMPNKFGCDSTVTIHFTVHPTHVFRDTIDICAFKETTHTHYWNTGYEQKFTVPAADDTISYADTLTTLFPLDSIYVLFVHYREQTITYLDSTICYGDKIQFGLTKSHEPRFLSKTNVYRDTLVRTFNGCDSIIELRLNVLPRYFNDSTRHISIADTPFIWTHVQNGTIIKRDTLHAPGDYSFTYYSKFGCDSIDSLHLFFHQNYLYRDTVQICQSETPYTWGTKTDIYHTGEYVQNFRTFDGQADSTCVRFVRVMPVKYDTITATICEGDSMRFGLTKYNQPRFLTRTGLYNDTLTTTHGCDSIITLSLNFYPKYLKHHQVDIADVDTPYIWEHKQGNTVIAKDTLKASGEYHYFFKTIPYGCDSIDSLSLRIHATYKYHDSVTICYSQTPYTWYNEDSTKIYKKDIYETGSYTAHLQTHDGYDSTLIRFVNVLPVLYDTVRHSMCEGSDYWFNGVKYTEGGVYVDTLSSTAGCDSIATLFLTVNKPIYVRVPVDIYEGESYEFFGTTYTTSGTYRHYGQTAAGCDSIAELFLNVHKQIDTTVIVCNGDLPYIWTNKWTGEQKPLYNAGIYRNDTSYVNGERTFYTIQLIVNDAKYDTIRAAICDGHSYDFNGIALTESGIYENTVKGVNGCDSTTTLILTVNQSYYNTRTEHIIEGNSVEFFGQTCTTSGTYTHYGKTPAGCDSTSILTLIVHPLYDTIVTVCRPDLPYMWTNKWTGSVTPLYEESIYRNDTTYVNGERVYYGLKLVVNDPVFDTTRVAICAGGSYEFKGQHLTEQGTYMDTLQAANGCDSIETLILTVNQPYFNTRTEHIIEGNSVEFFGQTYSTTGTYTHYGKTPEGCDSTSVLQLHVHPLYDTIVTVCSADELPYLWINKWNGSVTPLYTAGIYRNDTTYVNGERMYYGLKLNVNDPVFDTTRVAICAGGSYEFKGVAITEQGIYTDTLQAANGCDSIETLILTVNQPYFNTRTEHIIEGNSVEFFGQTYSTTGTYTHYGKTPEGCDSTSVLQLHVHPLYDTIVTVCSANELPYLWINKWNGSVTPLYTAGIYRNDTTYVNGERMYYGLKLVVNDPVFDTIRAAICEGSSYEFNGIAITEQGIYTDTLGAANGCDSIETLILTINKRYSATITEHIIEGDSIIFYGDTLRTTGTYPHYARTPEGCDSTTILQLIVHPMVDTVVTVCSTDLPYMWTNKWNGSVTPLYYPGLYRNDTTFVNGERMYYGLLLKTTQPTDTTIYREICTGGSYNFNGQELTTNGEYRDTIKNVNGCDSIIILHLNVLDKFYHTVERTIYEGDSVMFQGQEYRTSGIYPVRFTSSYGCDSIVELRLTVVRLFDDSISVCANDLPYLWTLPSDTTKKKTIYESGIYRDTVVNSEGKQTAIGLKVTVLPVKFAPAPIVATICDGDFYTFAGEKLTEQGTYYDTLTAVNGCDSIISLSLQVMPVLHQIDTRTVYEGDTVFFHGDTCTTSGIYTYTERKYYGVDSTTLCFDTYQLILTVLKEFHVDTTAYVCHNDLPFVWHGYEYSETGDYSLPTAWTDSSRVVTTLHLTVRNTAYAEENVTLCHGNTFIINGDTIRESGSYYDTIPARNGCDSVTRYIISVQPVFERWDTVYISDQDTYTFCPDTNGIPRVLDKTGDYECVGKTPYGCDDIRHLHLEVHPSYHFVEYMDLCAPDTIEWHGQKIYAEGKYQVDPYLTRYGDTVEKKYFDRYLTTYGFDSIYELVVTNHPSYYTYEQHLIKELKDEGTYIHGIHITKLDTIYRDTLKTMYGCDSIFQIAVNTKRTITVERTQRICNGDIFDFYGQKLTRAGKYSTVVSGGAGSTFDTIVNMTLIVNPVNITKTRIVITDEDVPYILGGKYYTDQDIQLPVWDQTSQKWVPDVATTVIEDKYLNQYGCDSTNLIEFVVTTHYSEWNQIPLCTGSILVIDNDTISKAGQYTFVRRSTVTNRLDSLYRIEVYEAPNYEMPVVKRSICRGDTVSFAGKTFDRNGLHPVKLKSVDGCDSIVWLELTVYPAFRMDTTVRLMQEELPFTWESRKYYNEGTYERSWQIGECDSTRVLHLIVIKPDTTRASVCVNDLPYNWYFNNQIYTQSGIYLDTLRDNNDKVYAIGLLQLSVVNPTTGGISVSPINSELIKEDALSFDINFTTNQGSNMRYDIWFDNAALKAGFKNQTDMYVVKNGVATVPIPQPTDVSDCNPENQCRVRPGNYKVWIKIYNACNDSTYGPLDFQIKYPHWIIRQKWDDVVAPLSAECNCGYEFESVEWSVNGGGWIVGPYLHDNSLLDGYLVTMRAKRKGYNEAWVATHPITIHAYGGDENTHPCQDCDGAQVRPRVAPRNAPFITIDAPAEGKYDIYSSTGMFIEQGSFINGETSVTLPTVSGLYIIRTTIDERTMTHKVLLY